ncbi:hypothetical protein [Kitasatospora sp. NPDC005856]|uniref:hypothetical protein n=1 Tax=Kitasatospora sp. NPDC005856 TaxID=3154566 RepID=UPI003411F278
MPDVTGGFAKAAAVSAAVATAVLGPATPSHAGEREVPVSAAHAAHGLPAPVEPVAEADQGRRP